MELTEKEMSYIDGGAGWEIIAAIAAGVVFVIGVFGGYTNPTKCNN